MFVNFVSLRIQAKCGKIRSQQLRIRTLFRQCVWQLSVIVRLLLHCWYFDRHVHFKVGYFIQSFQNDDPHPLLRYCKNSSRVYLKVTKTFILWLWLFAFFKQMSAISPIYIMYTITAGVWKSILCICAELVKLWALYMYYITHIGLAIHLQVLFHTFHSFYQTCFKSHYTQDKLKLIGTE